ncbi:MAG: hypothetical protein COB02_09810 [Candidatus Cloacimonadota bacterium]|nr:MAG: hypothetical protein COB02_09810 [Candidatus Cloacimonadota bacterium]
MDFFDVALSEKNIYLLKKVREIKLLGNFQKSIDLIELAIQRNKNDLRLYFEYSLFLYQANFLYESLAIAKITKNLISEPSARLFHLFGDIYYKMGDFDKAIYSYSDSITLNVNNEGAVINISALLGRQGDFDKAIFYLNKYLESNFESYDIWLNLANLEYLKKNYSQAKTLYIKCLGKRNKNEIVLVNLCECLRGLCEWDLLSVYEQEVYELTALSIKNKNLAIEPPLHHLFRCSNPEENYKIASLVLSSYSELNLDITFRNNNERLRIGYLSDDLGEHPVAHLLLPIIKAHKKSKTQAILLKYGRTSDCQVTKKLFESSFKTIELLGDNQTIIKQIRDLELDIVIDLKGLSINHKQEILKARLAPIQISFLGYVGTTANPSIDYIITDKVVMSDKKNFTEKPIFMESTFMPICIDKNIKLDFFTRKDFGLPLNKVVLLVCVKTSRITKELFDCWLEILKESSKSVLWLITGDQESHNNLKKYMEIKNVDSNRIYFKSKPNGKENLYLQRDEHLARISLADLVLDSWIYNGHSTTVDAISAGKEVLCIKGGDWSSSVSASILNALGKQDLIFLNKQDYKKGILKKVDKIIRENRIGKNSIDLSKSTYSFGFWFQNYERELKKLSIDRKRLPIN